MVLSIFAFLLVFTLAVIVHEAGHFIAARAANVRVYEFSIGFPLSPRIATLRLSGTDFTVRLLPLGGFVRFTEDDGNGAGEFFSNSRKRLFIAIAGPAFNIIFAIILTALYFVLRGAGVTEALFSSLGMVWEGFYGTAAFIASIFKGSGSFENLSGPVGIAAMAGKAASGGALSLLYFTGVLSLSIGIFNLLPLPALDGGHIVLSLFEMVVLKGRRFSEAAYQYVSMAGFIALIAMTIAITCKDVARLFV